MHVGIDLGGTKIATVACTSDACNKIVRKTIKETQSQSGQDTVLSNIIDSVKELNISQIDAMGIGVPGIIKDNILIKAPNLKCCENADIASILQKTFNVPVFIENDANVAALGELVFGVGEERTDFLYITISTGIGGGLILNGQLYKGYHNVAGEIGHTIVKTNGPICNCGQRGCLEALASGTALTKRLHDLLKQRQIKTQIKDLVNGNIKEITTKHIKIAADNRDPLALKLIEETAYYISLGIGNYIKTLDPGLIVFGGGLMNFGKIFLDHIDTYLQEEFSLDECHLPELVISDLGQDSGVLGAAALAIKNNTLT